MAEYDPAATTDFTPVSFTGVSEIRREKPIFGKRQFRYPSEMTLKPDFRVDHAFQRQDQRIRLRFSDGTGEAFYLTAKVQLLDDEMVRFFDIHPLPTSEQGDVEFVMTGDD